MFNTRKLAPYLLIFPAIAVMIAIVGYPLVYGFGLSLTNMNLYTFRAPRFIGLQNFITILSSYTIYATTLRTFIWTGVNVFFHIAGGLFLALLLNRKLYGKNVFRTLLMIPWAIPQYIAVVTWKNMFRGQYGTIDILLNKIGIHGIGWLSDPNWTFIAAIITNIWLGIPFMMTSLLGGLQSIPLELYEAAEMDGVKGPKRHWYITLPMLKPLIVPLTVLGSVWTFNMVNVIYILTDNTGQEATQILVTRVYRDAFMFYSYGNAAAFSVLIFLILAAFSFLFVKAMKGDREVYD